MTTEPKAWADVEAAARHCPVLQAALAFVQQGKLSQLEAMIGVALWLSEDRQKMIDREVQRLMREPAAPIDCGGPRLPMETEHSWRSRNGAYRTTHER